MISLHYGHPGRDSMSATVSNIWWPKLHREVASQAHRLINRNSLYPAKSTGRKSEVARNSLATTEEENVSSKLS